MQSYKLFLSRVEPPVQKPPTYKNGKGWLWGPFSLNAPNSISPERQDPLVTLFRKEIYSHRGDIKVIQVRIWNFCTESIQSNMYCPRSLSLGYKTGWMKRKHFIEYQERNQKQTSIHTINHSQELHAYRHSSIHLPIHHTGGVKKPDQKSRRTLLRYT